MFATHSGGVYASRLGPPAWASFETEGLIMATAPQKTVTLKQLGTDLAEKHELSKKLANEILGDLITAVGKHLKKGDKIRIPGLGIFQVRKRPARMGRNPATGEAIKIKASKKIAFRAAKELKDSI
ncbi:HU family DNA-binding protein [Dongia sp.]|uniref:HU family DNA-binding protein n=1 Tax=Dongia sp. TaxID=1977262 RepID=UPI0035B2D6CA